ncbi:MAG TPA: nucleotidyltransferase family protein [Pyrinomonadaceae bacterium]|nr:nucleotidyltransferase family protein [Pyrinomonadaceae bacterium]
MKATQSDTSHAALALRLLSGEACDAQTVERIVWDELLRVARRNFVLVRLAERLSQLGVSAPASFTEAAEDERRRGAQMLAVIGRISRACEEQGIAYLFAKSFQHYPDMGGDIDLFVASSSGAVDRAVLKGTAAERVSQDLRSRMSGVAAYRVCGGEFALEIYHGRIGVLGEHAALVGELIRRGERASVGGGLFLVPTAEDLLVLQGMQRVYRHDFIRLCDVLSTVALAGRDALDWDYVWRTSEQLGTTYGLCSYLSYVGQIRRETLGRELLPVELRRRFTVESCGRGEFRGGVFRFPRGRVVARVYLGKLRAAARTGNWDGISRLSLMPFVVAAALTRRLSPRAASATH